MPAALTPPFAVAALVLFVAGAAKLRSPAGAVRALDAVGLPARTWVVRVGAVLELALADWSLVAPSALAAGAMALLYGGFSCLSQLLARRRVACGCFGDRDAPASVVQSALSAVLAAVAAAAAASGVHGIGWALGRQGAGQAIVVAAGIAAAVYATVLLYTQLPQAWTAWSGR